MDEIDDTFYSEKEISIEPDLGDLRKSTDKALPAPPKTPKRVMMKYRFSAVFPIAFAAASFVLTIGVVMAGQERNIFGGQYLIALNTSTLGDHTLASRQASAAPNSADVADIYYLYLRTVCSGSIAKGTSGIADSIIVEQCESYSGASGRLAVATASTDPSNTFTSPVPLANLLEYTSKRLVGVRIAIFVFLTISLLGSGFAALSAFPAIIFPHSRLLIFFNMAWTHVASLSASLAALISTALILSVSVVAETFGKKAGIQAELGGSVLLFIWLAWLLISLPVFYWCAIWFVDVRRSSILKRMRSDDEIGNWRGIGKELSRDFGGGNKVRSL